ncbi:MAG: hypothetical protein WC613_02390 [Candidatus Aenigmatarchaeota archaeon]
MAEILEGDEDDRRRTRKGKEKIQGLFRPASMGRKLIGDEK